MEGSLTRLKKGVVNFQGHFQVDGDLYIYNHEYQDGLLYAASLSER